MRSNYRIVGDFIKQSKLKNKDGCIDRLLGVNLDKKFMPSVANLNGVDLTKYKVIKKGQFGCKLMSVGRDKKVPISRLANYDEAIISSAYFVFEVIDENELNPEYLMMWFSRSESDRFQWFQSGADIRGRITWEEFCSLPIKVPSIEKQREIVKEYNTIVNRIKLNEQLNQKLEETAQALYKHWFVDFEFPNENGQPYKSSGGEMVYNEELDQEIPEGWTDAKLSQLCVYTSEREKIINLNKCTYLSTESMLPNRGGIQEASSLPNALTTTKFEIGDILISNIRPYFKKIWLASFNGGCSNDILCIKVKKGIEPSYLYFLLEQDLFFDYIMKGAKGTKMPRGDKDWIMDFPITISTGQIVQHFCELVDVIIHKQVANRRQNELLQELSQLVLSKMSKVESLKTEQVL